MDWHLGFIDAAVAAEDYEMAAAQRDAFFQSVVCRRRAEVGEAMALEALRREALEFVASGLTRDEWAPVRHRRMMALGVVPYDLIRYRSPFGPK